MDQDNQNQSVDGMRSSSSSAPSSGVDGFMAPPPKPSSFGDEQNLPNDSYNETTPPTSTQTAPKKSNKSKIWLIVFIVLFLAAAGAAVFMYLQYSSAKTDLENATKSGTQVSSLKTENDKLKQQNADLQTTVNSQTEYINSLLKVTNQLKTTCGSKCASIAIPPAPSSVPTLTPTATPAATPTPTPTATPKPTVTPTP